jgi:hypothetical protein
MQGLRCTANLRGNGLNGRPLGWIVVQVLENHAHGTFTNLRGVGRSLSHGLIFSGVEAITKPGAIHRAKPDAFEQRHRHTAAASKVTTANNCPVLPSATMALTRISHQDRQCAYGQAY